MDKPVTIHEAARRAGFDLCGVARSRELTEQKERFALWIGEGCDGGLDYLKRNSDKRFDPAALVAGARSVVICGISYNRPPVRSGIASRIASYALCRDYHLSIREKLGVLAEWIRESHPESSGRIFVDTAPLAEKSWAVEAGLGWIGRNSLLNTLRFGSFLLLGAIVTDAELPADKPFAEDHCGRCRRCIESCPTRAIREDRTINAARCIARKTIEKVPGEEGALHGWLFGCDVCQRVCPHNLHAPTTVHPEFMPMRELTELTAEKLLTMEKTEFERLFGETPLARCGLERLQKRLREEKTK